MNFENIMNHDVNRVDKLEQDLTEIKQLLKTHVLENCANNKNVEDYNCLFLKIKPLVEGLKI